MPAPSARLVAVIAGLLGMLLCGLAPLLPVNQSTATITWPQSVNAEGFVPGLGRAALREIPGKIVSAIAICLGFLWIIWDGQKQGWHDKIAETYVLRVESRR